MIKSIIASTLAIALFFSACSNKKRVDALYTNGMVYTVDSAFAIQQAFAVKDGKFIAVGATDSLLQIYTSDSIVDLQGGVVYPGFIDAHCHFYGYGTGLQTVDLVGCKSMEEMVQRVTVFATANPTIKWITGRGWDQNLWVGKQFPKKDTFDVLFLDKPVLLARVDGHAALANSTALKLAKVTSSTRLIGGLVEVINGKVTGILVDNAVDLVTKVIPEKTIEEINTALLQAQRNCFAVGLTTIVDAGLDKKIVDAMDALHKSKELKMRIYAMLNPTPENKTHYYKNGIYKTDYLNVRSFKIYADGALGSRGACLLHPYNDRPNYSGFLLQRPLYFDSIAVECAQYGFQMNTHCIGDSANRYLLSAYAKVLKGKNDLRWRIEHAQVVNDTDFDAFGTYSIIPSVQTTHATSDMYWAAERLGNERVKGAYAYKKLLYQNNMLANGSDFPVESINPLYGFYAAVARMDANNYPEKGFQTENALTREQALRAMTIWAAYANFEEKEKGSIESGKMADFVILEKDLMKAPIRETRDAKVKATFIAGEKVF